MTLYLLTCFSFGMHGLFYSSLEYAADSHVLCKVTNENVLGTDTFWKLQLELDSVTQPVLDSR